MFAIDCIKLQLLEMRFCYKITSWLYLQLFTGKKKHSIALFPKNTIVFRFNNLYFLCPPTSENRQKV